MSLLHEFAHFYDHVKGENIDKEWDGVSKKYQFISRSEIYATHVENIGRAEHNMPLRTRYKSMRLLKYSGQDALIDKETKMSLYYRTGDILITNFEFLKKQENGFKYK